MLIRFLAAIGIAASAVFVQAQDHGHLNVGAVTQQPGSKLIFANGADFATNSLYVKTLTFTNAATYANYFQGNTTVTALPATGDFSGPDPQAPALGSYIAVQVVSLEGPADGEFGFWEKLATAPTFSVNSGETAGTNMWIVSENGGVAGTDPFGHIHGRRFTLTKPGLYKIGLRALDISTNGPGGGPIHTPSEILYTSIQAGVNVLSVEPNGSTVNVRAALPLGNSFVIEGADDLDSIPVNWQNLVDPIVGADKIQEFLDVRPSAERRFYRVRGF